MIRNSLARWAKDKYHTKLAKDVTWLLNREEQATRDLSRLQTVHTATAWLLLISVAVNLGFVLNLIINYFYNT